MYVIVRKALNVQLPMRTGGSFYQGKVHLFRTWAAARLAIGTLPRRGRVQGQGFAPAQYCAVPMDSIRPEQETFGALAT